MMSIFIPRESLELAKKSTNPTICLKIPFRGYEISIACNSSHAPSDLFRSDIRVYKGNRDVTETIMRANPAIHGQSMIYGTGEQLRAVFKAIDNIEGKV